jgi:hypothetical protein
LSKATRNPKHGTQNQKTTRNPKHGTQNQKTTRNPKHGTHKPFTYLYEVKSPLKVSKKQEELSASDIPVLLKIGDHFIYQEGVQSVARFGRGSKIMLTNGDEFLVRINYDKVAELVK